MPKRTDISSILIIGAGPIIIGQACEFDYSGVQACKALKDEGFNESNLFVAKNFFEGNAHLQTIAKKGDVVLFENDLPDTYNE